MLEASISCLVLIVSPLHDKEHFDQEDHCVSTQECLQSTVQVSLSSGAGPELSMHIVGETLVVRWFLEHQTPWKDKSFDRT